MLENATYLVSSPAFWAGLFVVMMVIELSTTGAFAGFLGLGALVTAFLVNFGVAESNQAILFTFLASTCLCAALLWKPLKARYIGRETTDAEEGIEPFTGDFATVEDGPLSRSGGVILLHGARMRAVLDADAEVEQLAVGARVQVLRQDSDQRFVVRPAR
ncbi:MAG: hypothetical protein CMP23_10750 [Rickettsiales bacterium]|nr:hypothetical protein [Rickettsiales bacterium]|tara:strand:+ start:359 stop:838 length:480 start_codon:yes stop_codon:yes gene_type:complete